MKAPATLCDRDKVKLWIVNYYFIPVKIVQINTDMVAINDVNK